MAYENSVIKTPCVFQPFALDTEKELSGRTTAFDDSGATCSEFYTIFKHDMTGILHPNEIDFFAYDVAGLMASKSGLQTCVILSSLGGLDVDGVFPVNISTCIWAEEHRDRGYTRTEAAYLAIVEKINHEYFFRGIVELVCTTVGNGHHVLSKVITRQAFMCCKSPKEKFVHVANGEIESKYAKIIRDYDRYFLTNKVHL